MHTPRLIRLSSPATLLLLAIVCVLGVTAPATPRPAKAAQTTVAPQPRKLADENVTAMWLSPNGKFVVYIAFRDGQDAIWSVPTSGGSSTRLSLPVPIGTNIDYPTITQDSSRVVYTAQHPGDGTKQLYVVPIAGGAPARLNQPLTGSVFVDGFTITPDSRSAVFATADSYGSDAQQWVYSVPLSGGTPTSLNPSLAANQRIAFFSLSPDGKHIVLDVEETLPNFQLSHTLYSVPVAGGAPVLLDSPQAASGFQFTPDSSRVVYSRKLPAASSEELWIVPVAGGTPALIASANGLTLDRYFQLSADGQYVVYQLYSTTAAAWGIYSARLEPGQSPVQISDPQSLSYLGTITPDGKRVVYTSRRAGDAGASFERELRSVPIGGGASMLLSPPETVDIDATILLAPDGGRVLFRDRATDFLYTVPIDGSAPAVNLTPKLPQAARVGEVSFTEDSSRVFYLATRDNGELVLDLRMQPATGGEAISLRGNIATVGGLPAVVIEYNYVLSADDRFVVFRGAATRDGPRSLYLVDLPVSFGFRTWIPATAR